MEEPFDLEIDPTELSDILEAHKTAGQHADLKKFLVLLAEHYHKNQLKYTQPLIITFILYLQRIIKTSDSGLVKDYCVNLIDQVLRVKSSSDECSEGMFSLNEEEGGGGNKLEFQETFIILRREKLKNGIKMLTDPFVLSFNLDSLIEYSNFLIKHSTMEEVETFLLNRILTCEGILQNIEVQDHIAQIVTHNLDIFLRLDTFVILNIFNTVPEVLENVVLRSILAWISSQNEDIDTISSMDPFPSIIYSDQKVLYKTWNIICTFLEDYEDDAVRDKLSAFFWRHLFK